MRQLYYRLTIVAALAVLAMQASAADVDAATAQSLASKFMQTSVRGKLMSRGATLQLAHVEKSSQDASVADFYVFNTSDGAAYVIVAGDDRAEQILGYGNGRIDMATIPGNVRWWLDGYKRQMEYLRTLKEDGPSKPRQPRAPSRIAPVEPLLTSLWSQVEPYCLQCPKYQGEYCATGCIATAMAQVINYWKYPAELPALPSFVTNTLGMTVPALPGGRIDWDNMLDVYNYANYTPAQADAVAMLMRYCGQACRMDYSPEGSGAWEDDQLSALKSFGYNPGAQMFSRDETPDDQWEALLQQDLNEGRPVLYTGTDYGGGHAFVLDGFDGTNKYHVNWGWGGGYDGYFTLDAMGVSNSYTSFNYCYYQKMLIGVYPIEGAAQMEAYDFEADGIYYYERGDEVTVTLKNHQYDCYSGDVTIPSTVTHNGKTYRVTVIGDEAFMNCDKVTSVTVPSSVTTIGRNAFRNCQALKRVYLAPSVKSIDRGAFNNCSALETVEIDDVASWVSIDFENYSSNPLYYARHFVVGGQEVKDLVIPGTVKRVSNAFMYVSCLNSVTIEQGVEEIDDMAFLYATIKSVSIPGSVRRVGESAFLGCYALVTLTLGEGVQMIDGYAFCECENLKSVTLPGSLKTLGLAAFAYCARLEEVTMGEGVELIDEAAFYSCAALKSVNIPASVRKIGYAAFAFCPSLQEVTFAADGHVEIDGYAFYGCTSLQRVALPSGLTDISEGAFSGCTSLAEVALGAATTTIGEAAFFSCTSLGQIAIPASVTAIGPSAFAACSGMTRVDIADLEAWCGVQLADKYASPLYGAHHLYLNGEEVIDLALPAGVTAIGKYAFSGASALKSVSVPAGVKQIGADAFYGCTALARVDVCDLATWLDIDFSNESSNPVTIARHLSVGGEALSSLVIPAGVTAVRPYAFMGCEDLNSVVIGGDVVTVGARAFRQCTHLSEVTLGDGVREVGEYAFSICTALKDVTLGSSVETIGAQCFASSLVIENVTCKAVTTPALGSKNAFASGVYKKASLAVPSAAVDAYKGATYWSQFVTVMAIPHDYVVGDVNLDGEVNISDVNTEIAAIHENVECMPQYDINGDGEVNIADVNALIDIILAH